LVQLGVEMPTCHSPPGCMVAWISSALLPA